MTAQQKKIALLGLGAGAVCVLVVAWPYMHTPSGDDRSAVIEDVTTIPGATLDGTNASTTDAGSTPTGNGSPTTPTASSKTSIVFEYPEAARNQTYHIPWMAQRGIYASVALIQDGKTISMVPDCQHMPIRTGYTGYCAWTPEQLEPKQSTHNFSLRLTTYDVSGKVLDTVHSATFTSVPSFTVSFTNENNNMFGWSVRYPDTWLVKSGADYTVIANNLSGIKHPLDSHEALIIESCSLARAACGERQKTFMAASGVQEKTIGGKRSVSRSTPVGVEYTREDMLVRDGILFFITMRTIDASGTLRSPYLRSVVDSFGYGLSDITTDSYAFDGMFSTGALFVEHTDNIISYVRLYTGVEGCISTVSTDTFTEVSGSRFVITNDVCRIDGRMSDNAFTIEEKNCKKIHSSECSFEGTYTPID